MQLELNFDNKSEPELRLANMQQQIDDAVESMGKVRRKLFSQIDLLKKEMDTIKAENEILKSQIRSFKNEKIEWKYQNQDFLFEMIDPIVAIC
jgi:cell division protein FtsB